MSNKAPWSMFLSLLQWSWRDTVPYNPYSWLSGSYHEALVGSQR